MTGTQIFNRAIAIINEISASGTIDQSSVAEYSARAPYLLDMFQKEVMKIAREPETFEVSCFRKKNLLGDTGQYGNIIENNNESQEYTAQGANSFYFEVDGDCTVTLQEDGVDLSGYYVFNDGDATAFTGTISISVPDGTTSFLSCKGIFTPASTTSNITMTFSGDYYYRHNNRALSSYKFASADKVPDFKPWYKIEMPSDFHSRKQIISETEPWQYAESNNHHWEGRSLYVLFSFEGIIRIKYIPVPTEITSLTQELEIDDMAAQAGAYYLAEHFAMSDMDDELARRCKEKYRELKLETMLKEPLAVSEIIDVYDIGG
jgi:hypothetical protein